ncbi:hypothetical protein [Marinobacter psychrophilus]|jgi:hypothetical protein|nr:hypothetical protein [Marinobacter psychrophilus]MBQ0764047.1 hypothetical protein [Marinobacter psychrophilus]MBQ0844827.1 hypothetical protein [Marinobacter psychrophilus]
MEINACPSASTGQNTTQWHADIVACASLLQVILTENFMSIALWKK